MKNSALKMILVTVFSLLACSSYATVKNSDGAVGVDPILDSDDASVLITGEAAHQLYLELRLDGGPADVKHGKNILCRKALNYSGGPDSYQCSLVVSADGTVSSAN